MNKIKDYGFHGENIVIDNTHYMMKGDSLLRKQVLQADGDWRAFIPYYEPQFGIGFDTNGCSCFGTLNALEVLMKKMFGGDFDYAERYQYIDAGVTLNGGDPHKVAESVRKKGVVIQANLPMTTSYEAFVQPNPLTAEFLLQGSEWLMKNAFMHDWVFTNNPSKKDRINLLKEALMYSPVSMSVTAWAEDENGLYVDNGQPNTHWVCCVALELQPNGEYCPIIIDSYGLIQHGDNIEFLKKLHWDHHVEFAKRYSVTIVSQAVLTNEKKSLFSQILQNILERLGLVEKEVAQLPQTPLQAPTMPEIQSKPEEPMKVSLDAFCVAIRDYEGKPGDLNYKNNNPFNLRFANQTKAINANGFARFPTYEDGWNAGRQMIINACTGKSKIYRPDMTILEFFKMFAPSSDNNSPEKYALYVANAIGATVYFKIKDLSF